MLMTHNAPRLVTTASRKGLTIRGALNRRGMQTRGCLPAAKVQAARTRVERPATGNKTCSHAPHLLTTKRTHQNTQGSSTCHLRRTGRVGTNRGALNRRGHTMLPDLSPQHLGRWLTIRGALNRRGMQTRGCLPASMVQAARTGVERPATGNKTCSHAPHLLTTKRTHQNTQGSPTCHFRRMGRVGTNRGALNRQ
jgi:hypothetical protein